MQSCWPQTRLRAGGQAHTDKTTKNQSRKHEGTKARKKKMEFSETVNFRLKLSSTQENRWHSIQRHGSRLFGLAFARHRRLSRNQTERAA